MHSFLSLAAIVAGLVSFGSSAKANVIFSDPTSPSADANSFRLYGNLQNGDANSGQWFIEYGTTTSYGASSSPHTVAANATVTDAYVFISSGVQPSTLYHYRYRAIIGSTVYTGSTDYTITTAPAAVAAPFAPTVNSKLLVVGGATTLNVDATGVRPFTSHWKHNGVPIAGADYTGTGVSLSLNPIALTDAGAWRASVSNTVSSVLTTVETPDVNLVVADITKFPTTTAATEGGTITATVSLSPAGTNATYNWKLSTGPLTSAVGTISGQGTKTLTITGVTAAADATYQCDVTVGSDTVTLDTGRAILALKPAITVSPSPVIATVGQALFVNVTVNPNGPTPATTTVKGLPPGLNYSSANASITGTTYSPTALDEPIAITVESTNANGKSTLVFPLTVRTLDSSLAGQYDGIIPRAADPAGIGGRITLKATTLGVATGSLTLGTVVYPINAKLTSQAPSFAQLMIPALASGKNPTVNVNLTFSLSALSGTINGQTTSCNRSTWSTTNPVPVPGVFNCYFTPGTTELASPTYPHGHSIGSVTISSVGAVTISGRMADGTPFTAASTLSDVSGIVPVFASLYTGKGSVLGTLSVNGPARNVSNYLSWLKLPSAGGRAYASGFAAHDITCTGNRYVKPNGALGQNFLGLAPGPNNAHIKFTDSTLSAAVNQVFSVYALSVVVLPTSPNNPNALTLKRNIDTGMINGTFKVIDPNPVATGPVTRTGTYYGIAPQGYATGSAQAFGFFTLPNLPVAGATNLATNPITSGIAVMGQ